MAEKPDPFFESAEGEKTARIRALNDAFRTSLTGGDVLITKGVQYLGTKAVQGIIAKVRSYEAFTPANDPQGEHDFGDFEHNGEKVFWKIDYYDEERLYGSEDPSDPKRTTRVLTIMLASDY